MPDAIAHKRLTLAQLDGLRRGDRYAFPVEVDGRVVGVVLEVEGTESVPANDTAAGAAKGVQTRCQTCGEWDDPAEGCGCPERIRALLIRALDELAAEREAHAATATEAARLACAYVWPKCNSSRCRCHIYRARAAALRAGETKPHRTCGYSLCGSPDCADCFPDAAPGSVRYDDSAGEPKP
jgi:hypothetical protein